MYFRVNVPSGFPIYPKIYPKPRGENAEIVRNVMGGQTEFPMGQDVQGTALTGSDQGLWIERYVSIITPWRSFLETLQWRSS